MCEAEHYCCVSTSRFVERLGYYPYSMSIESVAVDRNNNISILIPRPSTIDECVTVPGEGAGKRRLWFDTLAGARIVSAQVSATSRAA